MKEITSYKLMYMISLVVTIICSIGIINGFFNNDTKSLINIIFVGPGVYGARVFKQKLDALEEKF